MTAAGLASGTPDHGGRAATSLSIGSVLDALRADFPEITISKIRFLESEGLISPARTPSGYRQFSHADVSRLRFVLSAQRDHYLPLKVIRAKLEEFDRDPDAGELEMPGGPAADATATATTVAPGHAGGAPAETVDARGRGRTLGSVGSIAAPRHGGGGGSGPGGPGGPGSGPGGPGRPPHGTDGGPHAAATADVDVPAHLVPAGGTTVGRETLLAEPGVDATLLDGLEDHGVLRPDASGRYEAEAPLIARTAASLSVLGVEPRLLRGLRAGADREAGLLTQLVVPVARSRGPEAARRAEELSGELAALSGRLHALLVAAGLRHGLRR